jgi:hypothetical protein
MTFSISRSELEDLSDCEDEDEGSEGSELGLVMPILNLVQVMKFTQIRKLMILTNAMMKVIQAHVLSVPVGCSHHAF